MLSKTLAPIILFVYQRLDTTKRTVEALLRNKYAAESELFIFSDGFKNDTDKEKVLALRQYLKTIKGFKSIKIFERNTNLGIETNYIKGVNWIFETYNKVIVVEDDIETNPYFLEYMNRALDIYEDDKSVFSVGAWNLPLASMPIPSHYKEDIFFNPRMMCWGFGVWQDRWECVDWETPLKDLVTKEELKRQYKLSGGQLLKEVITGRLEQTWDITYAYVQNEYSAYCVCPVKSLVNNIGFGEDASHTTGEDPSLYNDISYTVEKPFNFPKDIFIDEKILNSFNYYYKKRYKYLTLYHYTAFIYNTLSKFTFGKKIISFLMKKLFIVKAKI